MSMNDSERATYSKAVVLGASGFIGSNLVNMLADGGYETYAVSRTASENWNDNVTPIISDICNPSAELMAELDCAIVFHLVSSFKPSGSLELAGAEVDADIRGTVELLNATKERDLFWIYVSSGGTVYGITQEQTTVEVHDLKPICSYGVVKLAVEHYFRLFERAHGVAFVVARLANPFGIFQTPGTGQGVIANIMQQAIDGEPIQIWGDGEVVRDYIAIEDACRGLIALGQKAPAGQMYNLGSGVGRSINEVLEEVDSIFCNDISVSYQDARAVDVPRNVLDITKIHEDTGWQPTVGFGAALEDTRQWLVKYNETLG